MELVCLLAITSLVGAQDLGPVWLTVSSLQRSTAEGRQELQLNWIKGVDEVALYTSDPSNSSTSVSPVLRVRTEAHPDGMYQSNVSVAVAGVALPGGWSEAEDPGPEPGDHCLPYWVAALTLTNHSHSPTPTPTHVQCLKIRPTWMSDNSERLGDLPLTSVLWPGTHNSACYPQGLTLSPALGRFLLNQDLDVYTQLVFGIRYIDLRIGVLPVRNSNGSHGMDLDKSFWVNHDMIKVRPLVPVLRQIRRFLANAPGELVVVDLHRFPLGFTGRHARHNHLVALLRRELRDLAADYHSATTLRDLWQQGRPLVLAYGDNEVAKKHSWLWPPVRQQWGNQQTVAGLYEFLECCMSDEALRAPERGLWAAMAQLTPGPADLLLRPQQSLRAMAALVNPRLSTWLRARWAAAANILTSDFFLGNDAVSIAVAANLRRAARHSPPAAPQL